jgi:hypothetical protein
MTNYKKQKEDNLDHLLFSQGDDSHNLSSEQSKSYAMKVTMKRSMSASRNLSLR